MVLPGIPDGFPETAHSVDHTQRSLVEETDLILAADELSRAHPPTPTAPPLGRRPPALPLHYCADIRRDTQSSPYVVSLFCRVCLLLQDLLQNCSRGGEEESGGHVL